jgi:hypothetical protein
MQMKTLAILSLALLATSVQAELYGSFNSPMNFNRVMGTNMVLQVDQLPLSGKLSDSRLAWSESYWPSNKGGIAYRWNHPNPQPFKFRLHTKEELRRMNQEELGQLSPAELYDISQSDYSYGLTKKVLSLYNTRDLWWEGICHGWAQAAANYPEPSPIIMTNRDGIRVPFGASDVKALLAMHDAYNFRGAPSAFVGQRCKVNGKVEGEGDERDRFPNPPSYEDANSPECKDVNAGTFHLVLTNMIGIHSKSFVADIDRFNDVWNQPIHSYSSRILGEENVGSEDTSRGVVKKLRVKTKMVYGEELKFYTPELEAQGHRNFVSKRPVTGTVHQEFRHKNYEYILEIGQGDKIIGGTWVTETRPDFMWIFMRHKRFKDAPIPLSGLNTIYRPLRR